MQDLKSSSDAVVRSSCSQKLATHVVSCDLWLLNPLVLLYSNGHSFRDSVSNPPKLFLNLKNFFQIFLKHKIYIYTYIIKEVNKTKLYIYPYLFSVISLSVYFFYSSFLQHLARWGATDCNRFDFFVPFSTCDQLIFKFCCEPLLTDQEEDLLLQDHQYPQSQWKYLKYSTSLNMFVKI